MGDYTPTDHQLLDMINERLKKANEHLEWIKNILILFATVLGIYLWDHK